MRNAKQIGAWLAVVGIALAVQGCWEDQQDQQDQLTLLGDGGCRTADGGEGQPKYTTAASLDTCKAQCFDGNTTCTAIEYNTKDSACEVHSQPITRFEEVEGVVCYVSK